MRGRIYYVPTGLVTVTSAGGNQDIASIVASATGTIALRGVVIGQSSEAQDAEDEQLQLLIKKLTAAFTIGSGGASVTPERQDHGGSASNSSARRTDTTIATGGTITTIHSDAFNIRAGFQFWYPEGFEPVVHATDGFAIEISGPADDITAGCTLYYEEVGG